jgi:hypothetical protein
MWFFLVSALLASAQAQNIQHRGLIVNRSFEVGDPVYDPAVEHRYVLYAFAASCLARDLSYWNCTYCRDDTNGTQVTMYHYDNVTDTNALVAISHTNKESTPKGYLHQFNFKILVKLLFAFVFSHCDISRH